GDVASAMVVDSLRHYLRRGADSGETGDGTTPDDPDLSSSANTLLKAIASANHAVYRASKDDPDRKGMGSTVAAVWFSHRSVIASNVGDSPIFLIHDATIEPLSVMHTVEAEHNAMSDAGDFSANHPFRHMLTRGMGIEADVEADICETQCFPGDRIILCSDGLTNKATPEEIRIHSAGETAKVACARLVALANDRGGEDNVTVLVIDIKGPIVRGWRRWLPLPKMI
ncbi:MAG: protein phosphatase 2C domain-containing protein, partial [Desulfobacterales bacterium]